jgi:hypothetical protein
MGFKLVEKYEEDEGKKKGGGGTTHYPFPPIKGKKDCHGWQYVLHALVFMSLVFRRFKTWKGLYGYPFRVKFYHEGHVYN